MPDTTAPRPSRRHFLRLAVLAPLAAGCASLRQPGTAAGTATPPTPAAPPSTDPLAALRAVPLPHAVEPALIFRALGARGRCG
jgi:hypothetical protein